MKFSVFTERIFVGGVDASPAGAGAAAAAWQWAQAAGTPCQLVHAAREIWLGAGGVPGVVDVGPLMAEVVRLSRQDVERTLAGQVPSDLIATMMVRSGPAAHVLRDVAAERGADLVVLGAKRHGLVARWLGGSTAKNVTRALETAVLVSTGPNPVGRVLVALDVSDAALPTLATAERVARLFGAKLRVLHAIEPFPYAAEGITVVDVTVLAEQAEAAFETTVVVRRHGEAIFPVDVEVRFEDGSRGRERGDGRDRWKAFTFTRPARAASAVVDPDRVLLLDVDTTRQQPCAVAGGGAGGHEVGGQVDRLAAGRAGDLRVLRVRS